MELAHRRLPRVDILAPIGRMQAPEADDLKAKLDELFAAERPRLILDLSRLEFMSSAGLRVLIEAQRQAQKSRAEGGGRGEIVIADPTANIRDILARTGFTSFFRVFDDLVEAVGSF